MEAENKTHLLNHHYPSPSPSPAPSRLGRPRSSAGGKTIGEIVEVQGGHIVRSTGRKDRHSKVCTAKGPRDRRVRLAAHTAIQFYDVQDRLGYDRPSKAVDWLIKKAKTAIDELAQLPPWHPLGCSNAAAGHGDDHGGGERGKNKIEEDGLGEKGNTSDLNVQDSSFLPTHLESDSIADTVKSFFPTAAAAAADDSSSSATAQFHSFSANDLMPRNGGRHSQDLNLSLQSLQDNDPTSMMNNNHHSTAQQNVGSHAHHLLLSGNNPFVGYDGGNYSFSWLDQSNHHQRFLHGNQSWNNTASVDLLGSSSQTASHQPIFQQLIAGQEHFLATQRGPLQSSNNSTPTVHSWMDQFSAIDHHHQHQGLILPVYHPSSSVSGIGFSPGMSSGYAGFQLPARIRGDNEDRIDGFSDNPSSASSDSRR